jgi:hypothetical protein
MVCFGKAQASTLIENVKEERIRRWDLDKNSFLELSLVFGRRFLILHLPPLAKLNDMDTLATAVFGLQFIQAFNENLSKRNVDKTITSHLIQVILYIDAFIIPSLFF